MNIDFYKKDIYGRELFYIKDPEIKNSIIRLTGKKTINKDDIEILSSLGCKFKQIIN